MGRRAGLPQLYFPKDGTAVYWCRFTVDGQRFRLSTGARDKGEATKEAQRLHGLAQLGRLPVGNRRLRNTAALGALTDLAGDYLDWALASGKAESYVVKQESHLLRFARKWPTLDKITTPAIERYKMDRASDMPAPRMTTLYKELVTLSRFLHWCKRSGHLDAVPEFERIKPVTDYVPPDTTPEEVARVLSELPTRETHPKRYPVREFYTVQWSQGLRPGDVQRLLWSHIDLARKRITIAAANDKARTLRTVGMSKEAARVLEQLAKRPHRPIDPVFGMRSFRRSLDLAIERAGITRFTPHGLRHARLTELASSTRDTASVQFIAGHKNLSTTDRYVRSRTERTEKLFGELADSGKRKPKVGQKRPKKPSR
jgi:integrase